MSSPSKSGMLDFQSVTMVQSTVVQRLKIRLGFRQLGSQTGAGSNQIAEMIPWFCHCKRGVVETQMHHSLHVIL
jgi:hypothetical protein